MSEPTRPRRVLAEIRWGADPGAIVWVGNRTIHQYWPLLSGYFRDIFLAPQRRAEESAVSWAWREPGKNPSPSATELTALRKRLTADHQLFADNLTRGADTEGANALRGQGNVDELGAAIGSAVAQLVACSDDELARFVCRTENGLRVHSWGARLAAELTYPDTQDLEIAGQVIVEGKPSPRHEVQLRDVGDSVVARVATDGAGMFHFQKVVPGEYRLFAAAGGSRAKFPADGLKVLLARASVSGLVLRDGEAESTAVGGRLRRWPRRALVTALGLAMATLAGWGVKRWTADESAQPAAMARHSEMNSSQATASSNSTKSAVAGVSTKDQADLLRTSTGTPPSGAAVSDEKKLTPIDHPSTATGPAVTDASLTERPIVVPAAHGLPLPAPHALPRQGAMPASPAANIFQAAGVSDPDLAPTIGKTSIATAPPQPARTETRSAEEAVGSETTTTNPVASTARAAISAAVSSIGATVTTENASAVSASRVPASPPPSSTPEPAVPASLQPPVGRTVGLLSDALIASRWVRVSVSPWVTRLFSDVILPTRILLAEENESLSALRDRTLKEYAARMPLSVREPKIRVQLTLAIRDAAENIALRDAYGGVPRSMQIRSGRAEIAVEELSSEGGLPFFVVGRDNKVIAEFGVDADGWRFRGAPGVKAWLLFELPNADRSSALSWHTASGAPLPNEFRGDPAGWDEAYSGARMFVPLAERATDASHAMALIDTATGWGVVGTIRVAVASEIK